MAAERWTVPCPAKINTFLSVDRPDHKGWHPIRTIFQAVSLVDELQIELADEDSFESTADWLPPENTVSTALALLKAAGFEPNLRIKLIKRIPAESGLGGGSSDAAGLLRLAQEIAGLSIETLENIARQVGADVPFFLVGGRAMGEGYGEILTPLADEPPKAVLLARPNIGCSTPEMYRALDRMDREWRPFPKRFETYNDFERVAPFQCLDLTLRLLNVGAEHSGLSGSGSCTFGIFRNEAIANSAAEELRANDCGWVQTCHTLSREQSLTLTQS